MAVLLGFTVGSALSAHQVRRRFRDPTEESMIFRMAGVKQINNHVPRKVCDKMQETNFLKRVQKLEVEKRSTWSSESTQEAKCLLATLFQLQYVVDCTSVGDAEGRRVKKKATTQLLQHLCTRLEILLPRAPHQRHAQGLNNFREQQEELEKAKNEREEAWVQALLHLNKKLSAEGRKDLRSCLKGLGLAVGPGQDGSERHSKRPK